MQTIKKICLCCNDEFNAPLRDVKRGRAKFCSLKCSGKYNGAARPKPQPNVECAWCQQPLYRNPSKASSSKSGLFFCCDDHKNQAQSLSGIKELHLPHYGTGTGIHRYREDTLAKRPAVCERCGYDKHIAGIEVHHKDRNRENNAEDNLEVLCAICHNIEHYNEKENDLTHHCEGR